MEPRPIISTDGRSMTVIEFPCRCGHTFRLEDDQAGGLVQCPRCGILNDVPTHDDLPGLAEDGLYRLDETDPNPGTAADLAYIYQKGTRDADGNEIDLRLSDADFRFVGHGEPVPLVPDSKANADAPRYDPETGELIAPLELKPTGQEHINPADIPMAQTALEYASGGAARRPSFLRAFVHLLAPINLAVMLAVFGMHVLIWPVLFISLVGIIFFFGAIIAMAAFIIGHYGNVIEDTGPFERDELPRPLRDMSLYEDVWSPFVNVFGSLMICYAPAVVLAAVGAQHPDGAWLLMPLAILWTALGTFFLPAVLLTLQTSGSSFNLRPDRVLTVIAACGASYLFVLVVWTITAVAYLWAILGTGYALVELMSSTGAPGFLTSWAIVVPVQLAAIFLMHYFCMCVGLLYRAHYAQFSWILQRHIRTKPPGEPRPPSRPPPQPAAPQVGATDWE